MTKIVIRIESGLVSAVYADEQSVEVVIIDNDVDDYYGDDERLNYITEAKPYLKLKEGEEGDDVVEYDVDPRQFPYQIR